MTGMLYWLAEAALEAREKAGLLQVHIAAELNQDQSTVTRFEQHKGQPRDIDAMVLAYADVLQMTPQTLWTRAMEKWNACEDCGGGPPGYNEGSPERRQRKEAA